MPDHHHRPGSLRQSNKKNKRTKASKRSVTKAAGGKIAGRIKAGTSAAAAIAHNKADRRNQLQQKKKKKAQELARKNSATGAACVPPRVVGILALGPSAELEHVLCEAMLKDADQVARQIGSATCKFHVHKKQGHLTLLTGSSFAHYGDLSQDDSAVLSALDLARVCDIILVVIDGNAPKGDMPMEIHMNNQSTTTGKSATTQMDWDHLISKRGDQILAAVKSQGLPTPLTILARTEKEPFDDDVVTMQSVKSVRRAGIKRSLELKKYVSRFATTEFGTGNDRVMEVDLTPQGMDTDFQNNSTVDISSCAALIRTVCQMGCSPPKWVANSPRSHLISDSVVYDGVKQELTLTGYIRGLAPFDCNLLTHVPNVGTFAIKSVAKAPQPLSRQGRNFEMIDENTSRIHADPEKQESLDMFAIPDALEGEQNLIGFNEGFAEDEQPVDETFERPAGWSDYQSSWMDGVDDAFDDKKDHGELAQELNQKPSRGDALSVMTDGMAMDLDDANNVNVADKKAIMEQRRKEQSEHLDFPDEVEVNEDVKASDRFARYRSLKSFRKSFWDPKENLPDTFATIFHFFSFKQTQRAVMNDMKNRIKSAEEVDGDFWHESPVDPSGDVAMEGTDDEDLDDLLAGCIPAGSYVTLTLRGVAANKIHSISSDALLSAVSLLPHENKVSVLHMGLCQSHTCDSTVENPVKSKDVLTFRCGWRTWKARPVFSQNNLNCDKHKFERYMPTQGAFFAASIFGPVTYTPCPVLVFRENDQQRCRELIAIGSMIGADADRIVVKRIILTGYPVRVHKRHATVKYMFYNPDDVKWFKPADLYTKHGLQGNIEESVGEHGTMKCLFNAPIKQHDTVCLPLFKRIFPKFAPASGDNSDKNGKTSLIIT
jgi:pre-rRNA-processing protein TSR1